MAKMAKATFHYAQTVHQCWVIARHAAEAYQKAMNRHIRRGRLAPAALCKAARDAADRIALTIRYGRRRGRRKGKR